MNNGQFQLFFFLHLPFKVFEVIISTSQSTHANTPLNTDLSRESKREGLYLPESAQSSGNFSHLQIIKSCHPFPRNRKLGFILTLHFAQVVKEFPETNVKGKVAACSSSECM